MPLVILCNCNFNSCNLKIYVTWQGINVKMPDDDKEMSKHVAVYKIYCCDINCTFVGVVK